MTPLPEPMRRVLSANTHPGLLLDKYSETYGTSGGFSENVQRPALEKVVKLAEREPAKLDLRSLLKRREGALQSLGAQSFRAVTTGPLTLHLARASALENAGICLHPLYGFVHFPGSGLKGMAHAFACEVWLPTQSDKDQAWQTICDTFGWAPSPWFRDLAKRLQVEIPKDSQAGAIVFYDAWPEAWPALILDIVNNHHRDYYAGAQPPGDWEEPNMVSFLAIGAGCKFSFALSSRRRGEAADLLDRAREWLTGALTYQGAGAKTASGYGYFQVESESAGDADYKARAEAIWKAAQSTHVRAEFSCVLELVTPAFLAGAWQQAADCDLRPATLRGLLRWWWRTMHANYVDVETLRRMEAAVWGDTEQGAAVSLQLSPIEIFGPDACPGKRVNQDKGNRLETDLRFFREHGIELEQGNRTPGLLYVMYGMDEMKRGRPRNPRWYLSQGSKWRCRIAARAWSEKCDNRDRISIEPDFLIEEAKSALWLLCNYGGVGSKCRNGFGSLNRIPELKSLSWTAVQSNAAAFRNVWRNKELPYSNGRTEMHDLEHTLRLEIPTPWSNTWFSLHQIGESKQSFAQAHPDSGHGKHCAAKAALGLPRKVHGPLSEPLRHQRSHTRPVELRGPAGDRYAAPIFYHLARADGQLVIRVLVFMAENLWSVTSGEETNRATTHLTLSSLHKYLDSDLRERIRRLPGGGQNSTTASSTNVVSQASQSQKVSVKVIAPHEAGGKAGFKVLEEGDGKRQGILLHGTPPATLPQIGETIEVYRNNQDERSPQYRWDKPTEPKRDNRGTTRRR
jgi:CRISPR-associated protein Cmr6